MSIIGGSLAKVPKMVLHNIYRTLLAHLQVLSHAWAVETGAMPPPPLLWDNDGKKRLRYSNGTINSRYANRAVTVFM